MNIVEKYYIRKAVSAASDEKHLHIEHRDISLIKRAELYLLVAPVGTIGLIYLINKIRKETVMSSHFYYSMRTF